MKLTQRDVIAYRRFVRSKISDLFSIVPAGGAVEIEMKLKISNYSKKDKTVGYLLNKLKKGDTL